MGMVTKSYSEQIAKAIASFWQTKKNQLEASGDTTNRGAVVGGKQLDAFAALIKNIELAKAGEYDYTGIDADLAEIQNLGNTPQAPKVYNLALYYEGSATASKNPNSSEIIEVYLNRQYKIKNLQKESGARFINSIERSYGEDVIKDQGQSIQFKIKNAEIGQEFNLYYKRDNQILFTIKLKVVEERRTGMDLKID